MTQTFITIMTVMALEVSEDVDHIKQSWLFDIRIFDSTPFKLVQ